MKNKEKQKVHIKISGPKMALAVLLLWGVSLYGTWHFASQNTNTQNENTFPLLNERLKFQNLDSPEERNAKLFATLVPLKEDILSSLGDKQENVAFYVEDLNSGSWVGHKERDPFVAAALLKVPVAMAVMKKIDSEEWTLEKTFEIKAENKDNYFGELWKIPDGTQVKVERLLEEMIQNSDNTAVRTFLGQLSQQEMTDVYFHVGMKDPQDTVESMSEKDTVSKLSPKDQAQTYRALYNSTFLKRKSSNYILEILTQTKFDEVVPTVIPKDVKVAHKIGNFLTNNPDRPKQYHDCGIAYIPEHPYLYCIMTQSYEAKTAESIISNISDKTYLYFSKNGGKK